MFRISFLALIILCSFAVTAEAQQRVQGGRPAVPPAQPEVQAQDVIERRSVQCSVARLWMAHNGLLIDCRQSGGDGFHLAFDGGALPGGISAAMTLLTHAAAQGSGVRVDFEPDPQNAICVTAQPSPERPCGRVISFGVFTNNN
jgi:hypothetical protein